MRREQTWKKESAELRGMQINVWCNGKNEGKSAKYANQDIQIVALGRKGMGDDEMEWTVLLRNGNCIKFLIWLEKFSKKAPPRISGYSLKYFSQYLLKFHQIPLPFLFTTLTASTRSVWMQKFIIEIENCTEETSREETGGTTSRLCLKAHWIECNCTLLLLLLLPRRIESKNS